MWDRSGARSFRFPIQRSTRPDHSALEQRPARSDRDGIFTSRLLCSMAVGFMAIMAILIGFGDSQMRTTPLPHYPKPAVSIAGTSPSPSPAKLAEQEKADEQNKPEEAQKPAPAREDVKKTARAKAVRERKRETMQARLREQRQQRDDSLAWWGYTNQPFNAPAYAPFGQRTEY